VIGIGVIGYGYWGPNIARNVANSPGANLIAICESDAGRRAIASQHHPLALITDSLSDLFNNPELDAVCVATPVTTHKPIAMAAMAANKHVLVEKPLASSLAEANELVAEAEKRNVCLMVDHTYVYSSSVRYVRKLVLDGEIGNLLYYDSTRINLGLFQSDVNVIWDLAVHDLSILNFITGTLPTSVSATGMKHGPEGLESIAFLSLEYETGMVAHVNVNWLSPTKLRRAVFGGDRKMIVMDDLEPSEKIKIFDKGVTFSSDSDDIHKMLVGYRTGDMLAPHLNEREALSLMIEQFVTSISEGSSPDSDGQFGSDIVAICEAANKSLYLGGAPISPFVD
jgi:predicted dehydrogenase